MIEVSGTIDALPEWARDPLAPKSVQDDYARLEAALARLSRIEPPHDPEIAAAQRVLLVHQWRRILLRHADLPTELLPDNWRGEICRALVLDRYDALSKQADRWLDLAIDPAT